MARLFIGRKPLELPARRCSVDDAQGEARRRNPPFVVTAHEGAPRFNVRRRVFLVTEDGLRVECEGEGELRLACKLVVADHNRWQDASDDTLECVRETEEMERRAQERAEEPSSDEDEPKEEEDISIEEWGQLGYKWFRKEDVLYI